MVKGQNKNKPFQKRRVNNSTPAVDNEYDLERNIKRINSYSRTRRNSKDKVHSHITDSVERDDCSPYGNGVIETPIVSSNRQRTGDSVAWDSYVRLDDKITDFDYKNNQAHTDLRKELESKIKDSIKECNDAISKRLHIQWYVWTIIGLVTIVGIWYLFSYADVHPLPSKVEDMDKRLHSIENKINVSANDTTLRLRAK